MFRKYGKVVVFVVGLLLVVGLWNVSKSITSLGKSTREVCDEVANKGNEVIDKSTDERYTDRGTIITVDGETIMNQEGTVEEKCVQCVYDFFSRYLPDLDISNSEYSIAELEDGSYCVNVDDWYFFIRNESNISYMYKCVKSCDFTEYERTSLTRACQSSSFVQEDGLYVWKVE